MLAIGGLIALWVTAADPADAQGVAMRTTTELTFDGTTQVGVVVTFPDDTTGRFVLDTTTGTLTPVTAAARTARRRA